MPRGTAHPYLGPAVRPTRRRPRVTSRTDRAQHRQETAMPGNEKVLAFPVYPGVTPLDLIGPLTVLSTPGIGGTRYRTVVVGERAEPLATDTALQLVPAATFAEVPDPWAVVVPGGGAATLAAAEDEALLSYVGSATAGAEV